MERPIQLHAALANVRVKRAVGHSQADASESEVTRIQLDSVSDGVESAGAESALRSREELEGEAWEAVQELLGKILSAVGEIEQRRQQSLSELQQVAVELAVEIASQVTFTRIEAGEYPLETLLQKMLALVAPQSSLTVHLHPADISLLERRLEGRPVPWDESRRLQIGGDASLARGSCRVDAPDFGLARNVEDHLGDIRRLLMESLQDAQDQHETAPRRDQELPHVPHGRDNT